MWCMQTASCVPGPRPSVLCTSADDEWYCEPGSVCGLTNGRCENFYSGDDPCPSGGSGSGSSLAAGSATGSAAPENTASVSNSGTSAASAATGTESQSAGGSATGAAGRIKMGDIGGTLVLAVVVPVGVFFGVWGFMIGLL